jgi:hypothetical protein
MTIRTGYSIAASAIALLTVSPAFAQQDASGFQFGVTAGSLGVGPEAGFRVSPLFGVRASASFLDVSHDFDVDDIDYNGKVKLESYGAMLDLYPFKGGFRLSGGFRIDKNRVNLTATPSNSVTVGDATFTPAQIGTLSGQVDADDFVPVVTVGYAGGLTKGVKFGVDAGVMFQGKPVAQNLRATGSFATNPIFIAELEKERLKVNRDMEDYQYYPVVQLSLFYAF